MCIRDRIFVIIAISGEVTLRFTAKYNCEYKQLDSVLVENLTRDQSVMLIYPDTVLTLTPTSIDITSNGRSNLLVSQNYPNPFSSQTKFDVQVSYNDIYTFRVFDMMGRTVASHEERLSEGIHTFTFHACNLHSYVLVVSCSQQAQQRLMVQMGKSGSAKARIVYGGTAYQSEFNKQENTTLAKSAFKDGSIFDFEFGDELKYTGYVTFNNNVEYEEITDTPTTSTDYTFAVANTPPPIPEVIYGNATVYANETALVYSVDAIESYTYNWIVPQDWSITEGQGTHTITVNASDQGGVLTVAAENACGVGEANELAISIIEDDGTFTFVVETTADQTLFRFQVDNAVDFEVDWGNGNSDTYNGNVLPEHNYGEAGTWTIKVSGEASRIAFRTDWWCPYAPMLRDVLTPVSNGVTGLTSAKEMFKYTQVERFSRVDFFQEISGNITTMEGMFENSNFNQCIANWDVSNVTDMYYMFSSTPFNQNISSWDVSSVTRMAGMFSDTPFNQDISTWDVSKVTQMFSMFSHSNFNQDIGSWDVSRVENMSNMFYGTPFNQDISGWDVGRVNSMNYMFAFSEFNQNIGGWNVENVTQLSNTFNNTPFNQDISSWDVSNVTNMDGLFMSSDFNQDISEWDVRNVKSMASMFHHSEFNQDIGGWDVGNVTNMSRMFWGSPFNHDIGSWDVCKVTNMHGMFIYSAFNQDICAWDVSNVEDFSIFLEGTDFSTDNYNRILTQWSYLDLKENVTLDVGDAMYSLGLPQDRRQHLIDNLNWTINDGGDTGEEFGLLNLLITTSPEGSGRVIGGGNYQAGEQVTLSAIPRIFFKFKDWEVNEGTINDTQSVQTTFTMPDDHATIVANFEFNPEQEDVFTFVIETTEDNTDYKFQLNGASNFIVCWREGHIEVYNGFNVQPSHDFGEAGTWTIMVRGQASRLSFSTGWGCTNAPMLKDILTPVSDGVFGLTSTVYMFRQVTATSFTCEDFFDEASKGITNMEGMFYGSAFNQDISSWNVGSVTNMSNMFRSSAFNQALSYWDVSEVINMERVFADSPFNSNISDWDLGKVTNMEAMFANTPFNQDISQWNVSNVKSMNLMFYGSHFNQNISQWDVSNVTNMRLMFTNTPFNQDIGQWNVSNVTEMNNMFTNSSFNQYIGQWNVSGVTDMSGMLAMSSFDQDISDWDVSSVQNFNHFLFGSQLSTENYDKLLIAWSQLDLQSDLNFHAGNSKYSLGDAENSRQHLIDEFNWNITDAGPYVLYNLSLEANPEIAGSLSGEGSYEAGDQVTISAIAKPFFSFNSWQASAGSFQDANASETTFTMPAQDVTVTANFDEEQCFKFVIETTSDQTDYQFVLNGAVNLEVSWGDGVYDTHNGNANPSHDFGEAGTWEVRVRGQASRIAYFTGGSTCNYAPMLRDILTPLSEGITGLNSALAMFRNTQVESFTAANFFDGVSSGITNMNSMFQGSEFNQDISNWDVSNVLNMYGMFQFSKFNQSIDDWDVGEVTDMKYMFWSSEYNQPLNSWNVSSVQDMSWMFGNSAFNQPIGSWNVENVEDMSHMFRNSAFNQDINGWDVSNVKNMTCMFTSNTVFNQPLNSWDVANVVNMHGMFANSVFDQDISLWNVSSVTNMTDMFFNSQFNQSIDGWNVINVNSMSGMFKASVYNQPLNSWVVDNVVNMSDMFYGSVFNQDISDWNVGSVTNMSQMFYGAEYFNQPIGGWNVGSVTDMQVMFNESAFNQDISSWDVSNVTNMLGMFRKSSFDQDISSWDVSNVINFSNFLQDGGLSTDNYNSLLIEWSKLELQQGINFDGGSSQYDLGLPETSRQFIIDTFGWSFTDGGDTGIEYIE